MARTTISLPDSLVTRLEPLRDRLNVSEVCRTALEKTVNTYERIQQTLSTEDRMTRVVERLKLQRQEPLDASYDMGLEHGEAWAIDNASYQQFRTWSFYHHNPIEWYEMGEESHPFPKDDSSASAYRQKAATSLVPFEWHWYAVGFLDAVCEVWEQVKGRVEESGPSSRQPNQDSAG